MAHDPETVPTWVLQEVGRLHLHALALERELAAQEPAEVEEPNHHDG